MKVKILVPFLAVFVMTGCVSSGKYKGCLSDLGKCNSEFSLLDEELQSSRAGAASLNTELAGLKGQMAGKDSEIAALKDEVARLSAEKAVALEEKDRAVFELKGTYDNLVAELNDEIKKGQVAITQLRDRLSLSMEENILFDSGSSAVKRDGQKVLDRISGILKKVTDKQVRVEGHTDNVRIRAGSKLARKFPTNWELSTARATNVVRYLEENGGVDPAKLVAAGYAQHRPVASNETAGGRAKNRRIDLVLTPFEPATAE